jgi:hypothetical protein
MAAANVPAGTDAAPTAGQWQWVAPPFRWHTAPSELQLWKYMGEMKKMRGEKCLFCQIFKLKGKGHKPSGAEMKILQLKLLLKLLLKPAQLELITTNFCFSAVVYRLNSYSEGSVLMNVF